MFKKDTISRINRNIIVEKELDILTDLIVEKIRKDGHDNESFLSYIRETVDEVLLGIITEEEFDKMKREGWQ